MSTLSNFFLSLRYFFYRSFTSVLVFGSWLLAHLTRDLSQDEKKITVVTNWATDNMTCIFTQNDNFDNFKWNSCHFVHLLSLLQHLFSSQLEISHVVNGPTAKNQHRCRGPKIWVKSRHNYYFFFKINTISHKIGLFPLKIRANF